MLKHDSLSVGSDSRVPLELSSILLIEQDPELRDSRRILFGSLQYPVLAVSAYAEVCKLPPDSNCGLVAVDIRQNEHEARLIAIYARRTWTAAKILLLGQPSEGFDDPLYDDWVSVSDNPANIVETAERLLKSHNLFP